MALVIVAAVFTPLVVQIVIEAVKAVRQSSKR